MPNETLVAAMQSHMQALPLEWSAEEQDFARACQADMGLPETGLMPFIMDPLPEMTVGGATDVGDVSKNAPTGLFVLATMPIGVGLHTWPVTACGGMSIGDKGALWSAMVMAGVGYDLATQPELRAAARADFERRKAGRPFVSAIPADRLRPDGIPAHLLLRDGSAELGSAYAPEAEAG